MFIVAIDMPPGQPDSLAKPFAEATGKTNYEALARLRGIGACPLVVATFDKEDPARGLSERLRASGFQCIVLSEVEQNREASAMSVQRITFNPDGMTLGPTAKEAIEIPYAGVRAIVRGTSSVMHTAIEISKEKKFSAGKAILTSGLSFTSTTERKIETASEVREGIITLYIENHPPMLLRESGLDYNYLGGLKQATRMANFSKVAGELRARCTQALYDERLLNRQTQAQVLGPMLSPHKHLHIATAIIRKSIMKEYSLASRT